MLAASLVLIFLSQTPVLLKQQRPYCGSTANQCQCCEAQNEKLEAQNKKIKDINEKLEAQNEKLEDSKLVQSESLKKIKDLQVRYIFIFRSDKISCFYIVK